MKVLRAADHKRMPWKNGGGETVEVAISPEGAGLADFDWRVSMATVASDGPFSVFPGIDRTLSILEGNGMHLSIGGRAPVFLTQGNDPLFFPADVPVTAELIDGTITDLNVMTRRDRLRHDVLRLVIDGRRELPLPDENSLLLCHRGQAEIDLAKDKITLVAGDALLLEEAVGGCLQLHGKALLYAITIAAI
ncbi:HutD family protein [Rhizobium mesosinicum]|uniref:HutD family protein n=1 Tax=Rhizobium mesosinicum TaxID=335017 RepID=A0ABS7GMV5_9HYPH|nr:HutD family protein [Rhizobium mesosinicum]MBW9051292.1 HutD family protein [Rhizobium mesosinicum]